MGTSHWRADVLRNLRARNKKEVEPFAELVQSHTRAFERSVALDVENKQLALACERLRLDQHSGSPVARSAGGDDAAELKRKIYDLQEELTQLHRRKGENAQQVIDLTAQLKVVEREMAAKDSELAACRAQQQASSKEAEKLRSDLSELEQTCQLLKDEYQTLQLALTSAERKLIDVQKENDHLIANVMEFKERDVARMNSENEQFLLKQQELVRQQLEEAANENTKVVRLSGTGQLQAVGTESLNSVVCYSARLPNRAFLKFAAHEGEVNALHWSPVDGGLLATAGTDRKIKLWDVSRGHAELRGTLVGSNGAVMAIDMEAGGELLLAASSSDFASRVWGVSDQRLRHTLTGHSGKVFAAKFIGGQSSRVCTGSHDRTLKIWDMRSRACITTLFPGSSCNDVACIDESIVSGHFDKKIRFYDVRASLQPTSELMLGGKVTSVELSRNGRLLLACSRDDSLSLIDLRSLSAPLREFRAEGFHVGCDWTRACFSPDSEYVCVGSGSGAVYLWSIEDAAKPVRELKDHDSVAIAVAWQAAGNSMASCDKSTNVTVWADI